MKTPLHLAAAFTLLLASCAASDTPDATASTTETTDDTDAVIVGGYTEASADNPSVNKAEDFAISALYETHPTRMLAEVTKREIQVVAGLNHRFEIGLGGGAGNYKKMYKVVVYQPLQGDLEVTSIQELPTK